MKRLTVLMFVVMLSCSSLSFAQTAARQTADDQMLQEDELVAQDQDANQNRRLKDLEREVSGLQRNLARMEDNVSRLDRDLRSLRSSR